MAIHPTRRPSAVAASPAAPASPPAAASCASVGLNPMKSGSVNGMSCPNQISTYSVASAPSEGRRIPVPVR